MPKRKLLLVDEDRVNRFLCARIFASEGLDVTQVSTTVETVGKASEMQPDVIVLAIGDSETDDLEPVAALKRAIQTRDIPIVGMVDDLTPKGCRKAILAGCIGCIGKRFNYPFTFMSPESFKSVFFELVPFKSTFVRTVEKTSRLVESERKVRDVFGKVLVSFHECYQPGSIVELSNGVVGMVKEVHADAPEQPVVEVLIDESGMHPEAKTLLDLRTQPKHYIRTLVSSK